MCLSLLPCCVLSVANGTVGLGPTPTPTQATLNQCADLEFGTDKTAPRRAPGLIFQGANPLSNGGRPKKGAYGEVEPRSVRVFRAAADLDACMVVSPRSP